MIQSLCMIDLKINPADTGLKHLSFSAVHDFLVCPRTFRKRWIDLDFSREPKLPLIEGSAYHAALDSYWSQIYSIVHFDHKGNPPAIDIQEMIEHARKKAEMEYPPGCEPLKKRIAKKDIPEYESFGCEIEEVQNVSKSGRKSTTVYAHLTVDAIMASVIENLQNYVAVRDENSYTPLAIEQAVVARTHDEETGEPHPFPLKARLDLFSRLPDGRLAIVDHKYMGDDAEMNEEGEPVATPSMKLQAADYVSVAPDLLKALGLPEEEVNTVVFDIMNKKTGEMSQVIVEVGKKERMLWSRIFKGVSYSILLAYAVGDFDCFFLPNPMGVYGDISGWNEYEKDIEYTADTGEVTRKVEKQTEEYEPVEL